MAIMGFFTRRKATANAVIDLRHLPCPACGGTHTELGWMDRVARTHGHWCDDCGHAWKTSEPPTTADSVEKSRIRQ